MTISRIINGKMTDIQLTSEELLKAYYEQQRLFDVDDILEYITNWCDKNDMALFFDGKNPDDVMEKVDEIAYEFRKALSKYANDSISDFMDSNLEYAVKKVLAKDE